MSTEDTPIKEVVGIFNSDKKLQAAIDALGLVHFGRQDISVIGNTGEKFLDISKDLRKLVDDTAISKGINITPEERGVGTGVVLSSGLVMGVAGALLMIGEITEVAIVIPTVLVGSVMGIFLGGVMAKLIGNVNSARLKKQINKGGLVLCVRVNNLEKEILARKIFKKYNAKSIRTHLAR